MDGGLKLGRVLGIPFAVHHTWLIAFGLVAWSLAVGFFPDSYTGWSPAAYWLAGALAALLLFLSVLVHEGAHALVARARGLTVRGITLFVFGGVSAIEGEAERPLDEFLIALGVARMFGGDFLGGMWTAFIGWFLNGAAEASRRQLAVQAGFRGVRVRDLMTPDPDVVPPTMPLDTFVREEVVRRSHQAAPAMDGDRLVGVVSIADAQKVNGDAWTTTPVSAVMTTEDLAVVAPGEPVERGLKLMAERDLHQVLVVDGGRLVGLLTRGGLVRFVALREQFGLAARPGGGGRTAEPGLRRAA